jgi:serine/threonine-protein kinase
LGSLVGQRLGDYLLEEELGAGSMGVVYRARHVVQGKLYAVKVLLEALATDESFITRFVREARVVASLHHPNIVSVYEAGRQGPHIFFVMEYFPGVTAGHLLRERKRLPFGLVMEIAAQAADALAYAHVEGRLVHRDIKPENLLVDRWCKVKVLDFGLARIQGTKSITLAGTVVGSLYYVAPEQLLGYELDGRSDVYALGISMYEMLTGQRPYHGQTLTEMSDAILSAVAVPPSRIEPTVPRELEQLVARAMARDLNQRYRNASELYADLRALQAYLPEGPTARIPVSDLPIRDHTLTAPPATPRQGGRLPTLRYVPDEPTQPTRRISRVTGRPE